jgi:hypothetical protein
VANEMNDVLVADDDSLLVGLLSEIFKESVIPFERPQMGSQH